MAESQFSPGAPAGYGTESAVRGMEQAQSLMQRAGQLRQQKQIEEMRAQQIEEEKMLFPVKMAQAQANVSTAQASIATNTQMQLFRTKAATVAPLANDEFMAATQLADWDAQSAELSRIQARYSWMGNVPEYKPLLEAVDKARANAVTRALTDQQIEARMQVAEIGAEARTDVAGIAADTRIQTSENTLEGRRYTADRGYEGRAYAADARASTAAAEREAGAEKARYSANQRAAIQADQDAAKAAANGDEGNAAIYRKHAAEFRAAAEKEMPKEDQRSSAPQFKVPGLEGGKKLYTPPAKPGEAPGLSPDVKSPKEVIGAFQQMVDDGVISAEQARDALKKMNFKPKG